MPGSYDFDHAADDESIRSNERPMASSISAPVYMKDSSLGDIPDESVSSRNEKEPALDSPSAFTSPLPQMNDATLMSGLKPIFNGNSNGDAVGFNNDSYRSNVLDSLRNAGTDNITDDTEFDDKAKKEREILTDDEPHDRSIPISMSTREILKSNADDNAMKDIGENDISQNIAPHTFHDQSKATDSTLNPELTYSSPNSVSKNNSPDKEQAVTALAAAAIGTAIAVSASNLSDPPNDISNLDTNVSLSNDSPFDSTNKSYVPESHQGGLGSNDSKPFTKNAKDTELRSEDQPSFTAEQEKLNRLNGTDVDSENPDKNDTSNSDNPDTSNPDNINESDNPDGKSKPYVREAFQGGLGGDSTEPYIKNAKDTLLKPEDQPSFAAEQEKLNILNNTDEEDAVNDVERVQIPKDIKQVNMSKPFEGSSKSESFVPKTFQGGPRGNGTETYITNEEDTLLQPEDQPSFDAEQERLSKLNSADNDIHYNEDNDDLNDTEKNHPSLKESNDTSTDLSRSPGNSSDISHRNISSIDDKDKDSVTNIGSTLSKIGAGATGIAGAAGIAGVSGITGVATIAGAAGIAGAAVLGLSGHDNDLNNDRDTDADVNSSNTSDHDSAPQNVYLPSLTSDNSFKNDTNADLKNAPISNAGIISNEALSDIADKVDADVKHNALADNSINEDGVISSNALDEIADNLDIDIEENAIPISTPLNSPPGEDVNVLVDRDTSLPSNIENEVDIETANNYSNRSPLGNNFTLDNATPIELNNNGGENITSDLNNDYTSGPSAIPDSGDINTPVNITGSDTPSDVVRNASNFLPFGSLNPKDSGKNDSSSDDNDRKENEPGFFSKLFSSTPKPPEPASRSVPATSNDSTTKIPSPFDVNNEYAKFDASKESKKYGISDTPDDRIIKSSEVPFTNSNINAQDIDAPKDDTHVGSDLSDLNDAFDKIISGNDDDETQIDESSNVNENDGSDSKRFDTGKLNIKSSIDTLGFDDMTPLVTEDRNVASPRVEGEINTQLSNDNVNSTPPFSGALGEIAVVIDGIKYNLDKSLKSPIEYEPSPTGSNMKSHDIGLPTIGGSLDKSIDTPESDSVSTNKGTNIDENVDGSGLSSSLGKLSASIKNLKSDIDGKIEGSTPHVDAELPSRNIASNNPNADISGIDKNSDGTIVTSGVSANLPYSESDSNKSTAGSMSVKDEIDIDVDDDGPGLPSSLDKLSAGLKSLKNDMDTSTNLPSLNADLEGSDVNQPPISSLDTDSGNNMSSVDADLKGSNIGFPVIESKFDGSVNTPKHDDELPSFNADLKESNFELPECDPKISSVDDSFQASKFDNPSIDDSINTSDFEGKAPSHDVDLKNPNENSPQIDSKLDRSISTPIIDMKTTSADGESPQIDADLKSPKVDLETDENVDCPGSSGSLGKVSSSFKESKDDISGKSSSSVDAHNVDKELPSPNIDKKLPSLDANLKGPNVGLSDVDGKFYGSIDTPNINKELPPLDTDAPNVYKELPSIDDGLEGPNDSLSNIDRKSDGKINTPNDDGKLPSMGTDLKESRFEMPSIGDNVDSSFSAPNVDAKPSSLNTDLDNPNVNRPTPDINGKISSADGKLPPIKDDLTSHNTGFDTNVNADGTGLPGSLGKLSADLKGMRRDIAGTPDGSIDACQTDGDYPSLNAAVKGPGVGSKLSGEINTPGFDRSVSTFDSNSKAPQADLDTNVNTDRSGLTGTFGKLTSGIMGLKNNITGKFNGSADSPDSPDVGENINSNITTPKVDVDVPDVNANLDGPNAPPRSPNLSLDKLSANSNVNADSSIKSPNMDVDVPEPNSGVKGSKANAGSTGLDGSMDAEASGSSRPSGDISTDLNRPKADDSVDRDDKSTSFFGNPLNKITEVISSFVGDEEEANNDKPPEDKTEAGHATLRTTSRNKSPDDLSAMLDDIAKNSLGETPSDSDINPPKLNKKTSKSRSNENLVSSFTTLITVHF